MHLDLVDSLRCPYPHEDIWLVASVTRLDGREMIEGWLGCPSCRRQFPVRNGEADFTVVEGEGRSGSAPSAAMPSDAGRPDEGAFLRARALLALSEPGGTILLGGGHARHAESFEDEGQVRALLLNALPSAGDEGRHRSALRAHDALPVASGTLRAAWLDRETASPGILQGVVRALRRGGRLVAPADAPLPAGVRELARDAQEWVAEGEGGVSAPVALRRR